MHGPKANLKALSRNGVFVWLCFLSFSTASAAQESIPPDAAPPPLKVLTKAEKEQLAEAKDVKERTKLTLELMGARIKVAEGYLPQDHYEQVFTELGGFHALVVDVLEYLSKSSADKNKVLDNFKRFELGLRALTPRVELIHRQMPPAREYYLRILLRELRDARTKAIEPLFGDVVTKRSDPQP